MMFEYFNSRPLGRLFSTLAQIKNIKMVSTSSFLLICLFACTGSQPIVISGPIMGTHYRIVLNCSDIPKKSTEWQAIALSLMNQVNESMSTYQADSELSKFNANPSMEWQAVSSDLWNVLNLAKQINLQSQGAFDPTVSKLVDLWGFGAGSKKTLVASIPNQTDLNAVAKVTGFEKLEIDSEQKRIRKKHPELNVDLSAIAKGYAVDKVSSALKQNGCKNHLIDIGGELKGAGVNSESEVWRVGIEKPALNMIKGSQLQQLVRLNTGMASSGDYRNYFEKDGKRYSHTIDPRTLKPIEHTLASVTVFHENTAIADAWATSLTVLGDKAYKIAQNNGLAVYLIYREKAGQLDSQKNKEKSFITKSTKQFEKFKISK